MNYQFNNTLATDYASKPGDFKGERITTPRPSCIDKLRYRRALMDMLPGYGKRIGGLYVRRTDVWHDYTYTVKHVELTLERLVFVLEGREDLPKPARKTPKQKPDRLPTVPAPRVFPSAIDRSAPIALGQLDLFALLPVSA